MLYSFRRCPYAMRARLALAASDHTVELREVALRDKPPELLAASPKGTVPVLVTPCGSAIDQSLDIMRWALARRDPLHWLACDAHEQADEATLLALCDGPFKQALDVCKYPERHPQAPPGAARAAAGAVLATLESRLARHRFLCGDQARLADAAWMPFVRQFAAIDRDAFDAQPWPGLRAWLDDWLQSDLFACVMHKYVPWHAPQPGMTFPPPDLPR